MASYVTPKKNTAFITYISLVSQADTKLLKSGPTLAAGDFKVSIDGGAFNNLATLPTNTPGGVLVKISLSSSEMNGDNISVACLDAAGAEWCDQLINIQTSARQIDDLAYPATSGRSMVVDASGLVDANAVKLGPTGAGTAQTARDIGTSVLLSSGTGTGQVSLTAGAVTNVINLVNSPSDSSGVTTLLTRIASVITITSNKVDINDKTGFSLSVAGVQAIWDALTSALTTATSIGKLIVDNLNATITSRLASGSVTVGTNNDKTGYSISGTKTTLDSLQDISSANVLTQINSAFDAAGSELSAVPSTTGTIRQKLNFIFEYFRNKKTITSTTETVFKEDASTALGTATVSDSGTVFTKGEMN